MRLPTVVAALVVTAAMAVPSSPVFAQPAAVDTAARRQAMAKLAFLAGDWEGEATASLGPGRQVRVWQTEWVRPKLKGGIVAVEGMGRLLTDKGPTDTLFNAWAVIDWAPDRGYFMRSHLLDGRSGEFPVEVTERGFVWGFEVPGGRVRYSMVLTPDGLWHERGEFSRDGQRWFPTMEMKLKRTSTTP